MSASATVLALPHLRSRVHQQVVEVAAAVKFYRLVVDPQTGAVLTTATTEFEIAPRISTDEVSAAFDVAGNTRADVYERAAHTFEIILEFSENAICEEFENKLMRVGETVIPSSAQYPRQVRLIPSNVRYTHPPLQGSATGTVARYTVSAEVGRP